MVRQFEFMGISAVLVLLVGGPAWAQSAPAASSARQLPTLAVIGATDESGGKNSRAGGPERENVEDLLTMELGQQPFFKLVDRQALEAVMKEHSIALSNLNDAKNAMALGKFAGA